MKNSIKIFEIIIITMLLVSSITAFGMNIKTIVKTEDETTVYNGAGNVNNLPYNGRLRIYIVEPRSQWDNYDREPYHFGFLDFAFDDTISIEYQQTYNKLITWDGNQIGYGNIRETNIMAIAVVNGQKQHNGYAYPPSQNPFNAYYVDATAAAKPGDTGYNKVTENFTHTVFAEEATAPWCPHCPDMADKLYTIYESVEYPFYFVALVSDVGNQVAENRLRQDYNVYGYPTVFLDGGYKVLIGSGISENTYKSRIKSCGKRDVHTLNLSTSVEWMGDSILQIEVNIVNNEEITNTPPNTPMIDGPVEGKVGAEHEYTFMTIDSDGDDVYYWITWGDESPAIEWIGPYPSGTEIALNHTFSSEGTYTIGVKAKDINEAESDWRYLEVTFPKNKAKTNPSNYLVLTFYKNL